jgi:4-amino-4-deoxychorismate lyase
MLLETIKCKDGKLFNLAFHQDRFDAARLNFYPEAPKLELSDLIEVPAECQKGLFRCRVLYAKGIEKIEFLPHRIRDIQSLRLVVDDSIEYPFKYADRAELDALFNQRADCDDILIVKNDCITDSYYANPIFFDGEKWWASDTPLLKGTQRARLLAEARISVCRITVSDLLKFKKIGLVNALQDMDEMPVVPIGSISGI